MIFGQYLLCLLAFILMTASPWADFNRRHVFHPLWPAHAKFHNATYALMNVGCGGLCLWLLWAAGHHPTLEIRVTVLFLLAWSSVVLIAAQWIPGVSPVADGERILRGQPVSFWSSLIFLALTGLGGYLYGLPAN